MLPDAGDLVWADFNPVRGREQAEVRPALILTPKGYHQRSPLALLCPITSNTRPWTFKVILPAGLPVSGAILVDQLRVVDRNERIKRLAGQVPQEVLREVLQRLEGLLSINARSG